MSDAGSTHGTFVNSQRLSEAKVYIFSVLFKIPSEGCVLRDMDQLTFGSSVFCVHIRCESCESLPHVASIQTAVNDSISGRDKPFNSSMNNERWDQTRAKQIKAARRELSAPYAPASGARDRARDRRMNERVSTGAVEIKESLEQGAGAGIMRRMGWDVGKGLGKDEDGRREPVAARQTQGRSGIGHKKK